MRRRADVPDQFKISFDHLERYEAAGILKKLNIGGFESYLDETTLAVIAKAENMGFSVEEIVLLVRNSKG